MAYVSNTLAFTGKVDENSAEVNLEGLFFNHIKMVYFVLMS